MVLRPASVVAVSVALCGCGLVLGSGGGGGGTRDAGTNDAGASDAGASDGDPSSSDDATVADAESPLDANDGSIATGCDGPPITVSTTPSGEVSIVWTGAAYALAWEDARLGTDDIYLARFDETGARLGPDVRVSDDPGDSEFPDLEWNGAELAVVWHDSTAGALRVQRMMADGALVASPTTIPAPTSDPPKLSWHLAAWNVVWSDQADVSLVTVSGGGSVTPARTLNTQRDRSRNPAAVSIGSILVAGWLAESAPTPYEVRITSVDGAAAAPEIDVTGVTGGNAGTNAEPEMAWDGTGLGVVWWSPVNDILFAYVPDANPASAMQHTIDDTTNDDADIAWGGDRFGIVFESNAGGASVLRIVFVTTDGAVIESLTTADEIAESDEPAIAAGATTWAVAWEEGTEGGDGIRLQILCR